MSSAELFFDLVFVFVVTQLSARLVHDLTVSGAAETTFLLLAAWWAWVSTTWVTNWFDASTVVVRAILLVAMTAGLLGAISIPDAFGDRAPLLVAGYVGINSIRNIFVVLAAGRDDPMRRVFVRILVWTLAVAPLWIAGLFTDGAARAVLWALALGLDYLGPVAGHWTPGLGRTRSADWSVEPSHFVERLELFLIIALGESIVASGATTSGLEPTAARLIAMFVCMLMTALLWWLYFDFHAGRTFQQLRDRAEERGRLAVGLSYLYVLLVAGIIVAAVGNELVIAHPGEHLHGAELVAIAAGPILYLAGSVGLKMYVLRVRWQRRLAAATVIAGTAALGTHVPSLALWAVVVATLTGLAGLEALETRHPPDDAEELEFAELAGSR